MIRTRHVILAVLMSIAAARSAHAAELLFSTTPITADERGRVTPAARRQTTTRIPSVPGKEHWRLHVWAELEGATAAPLTITLFGKLPDGRRYPAFRHVVADYEGGPHVSATLELDAKQGLRRGESYTVELTQFSPRGKLVKLAGNRVTLTSASEAAATEPTGASAGPSAGASADGQAKRVSSKSATSPADATSSELGPPPLGSIEQSRGCTVVSSGRDRPLVGIALLGLLASARGRRRARGD